MVENIKKQAKEELKIIPGVYGLTNGKGVRPTNTMEGVSSETPSKGQFLNDVSSKQNSFTYSFGCGTIGIRKKSIVLYGEKARIPNNALYIVACCEKQLSMTSKSVIMDSVTGQEAKALYEISNIILDYVEFRKQGSILYYFDGIIWKPLDDWETLKRITVQYQFKWHQNLRMAKWKEVYSNITMRIDEYAELEDVTERYPTCVCFRNGVYSVMDDEMLEHDPEYPFTSYFNFDFDPSDRGEAKVFNQYLKSASDGDERIATRMLQWMAYCCSELPNLKKFALILGEPNSGKSTFADIICHIVGKENVKGVNLNSVDKFSHYDVVGMKIVTCTDLRPDKISSEVAEWLKMQTGNDMVQAAIKHQSKSFSYRSRIRYIFASNYRVDMFDKTLQDRALIIPMKHSLAHEEIDYNLANHIKAELQYVFVQMFDALREFISNDMRFESIGEYEKYIPKAYRYEQDSVSEFFQWRCRYSPGEKVSCDELYSSYRDYCKINCYEIKSKNPFCKAFKDIAESHNDIKEAKVKKVRGYKNIIVANDDFDVPYDSWFEENFSELI